MATLAARFALVDQLAERLHALATKAASTVMYGLVILASVLAAARARGVRLGRPPAMSAEQIRHARNLLTHPDNTVSSIARLLGVSRSTIYKYVPELGGRTADATPALDTVLAALPAETRPPPDVTKYEDLLPSRRPPSGGR